MVMFVLLYKMVLNFESVDEVQTLSMTFQTKAVEQLTFLHTR